MKKVVPCDGAIKRCYRIYVVVDEEATDEEVVAAVKSQIVERQDESIMLDPDLEIEEDDILGILPDDDGTWLEDDDYVRE